MSNRSRELAPTVRQNIIDPVGPGLRCRSANNRWVCLKIVLLSKYGTWANQNSADAGLKSSTYRTADTKGYGNKSRFA